MTRFARLFLLVVMLCTLPVTDAAAQFLPRSYGGMSVSQSEGTHSVSLNPIGWTFDFYNVEYEGKVMDGLTAGAGGSMRTWLDGTRLNSDVFLRYYLSGHAFAGTALGIKAGPTRLSTGATHVGVGFDINQTVPLGDRILVSSGFGVKRLIGAETTTQWSSDDRRVWTLRFNVGVRF